MGLFPFTEKSHSAVLQHNDLNDDKISEETISYEDEKKRPRTLIASEGTLLKSISHYDNKSHKFYKPTSNQTWVLSIFLAALGLCIAGLEWSVYTHPDVKSVSSLDNKHGTGSHMIKREISIFHRQAITSSEASDVVHSLELPVASPTPSQTISPKPTSVSSISSISLVTSVSVTSTSGSDHLTGQPFRGSELTIKSSDPVSPIPPTPGQPFKASQLSITSGGEETTTAITVGQPFKGSQLSITSNDRQSNQITVTDLPSTVVPSPPASAQLSLTQNQATNTGTRINSNQNQATNTEKQINSNQASTGLMNTNTASVIGSQLRGSPSGNAAALSTLQGASAILSTSLVVLTNSAGEATATSSVPVTAAIVLTNSNGESTATRSGSSLPQSTTISDDNLKDRGHRVVNEAEYFVAMYIPSIIGVVMQSAWLVTFATFKLMQPFYQLAGHNGATAKSTLTADYLATGLSVSFSRAFLDGHWVMILAGLIQFFLALVVTFASEAMKIVPTAVCKTEISDAQPCNPRWVVHVVMIRALEVALVACFSMTLAIIVLNRKRVSGVYSDPSKIATMADVLVHKPLINELRDLPALASKSQIAHDLQDSRYMLGTFVDENNRQHYGIIKLEGEGNTRGFTKEPSYKSAYRRFANHTEALGNDLHNVAPYTLDGICMALVIILFGIVLGYYLTPEDSHSSFNSWMNSKELGPSIVLTCFGVIIGFLIKRKERFFRLSHPYVLMAKGPQPASQTITAGTRATQFSAFASGVMKGNISLSLLSLAAVFSDIILVLIPGIPFTGAQTRPVYLASTFTVLGLLGFIFLVQIRITLKEWQRGHIECPETVASALMRLCASRFIEEKNIREHWSRELDIDRSEEFGLDDEAKQHLRYDGLEGERRYRFGCMEGIDGVQRWMVEEDIWQRRI